MSYRNIIDRARDEYKDSVSIYDIDNNLVDVVDIKDITKLFYKLLNNKINNNTRRTLAHITSYINKCINDNKRINISYNTYRWLLNNTK